ncbi:hypothetical protein UFOVP631_42 [uncultured Caudovirales phage]|uniref:Uncharacterized protein n=1 Tax=uncultured Caudovirales phage TaxID=2100421 RepID=A0A6J5NA32_9CAUD|nr:hypothetical protein UFOVP631_42 [uncultured Caudovirales phage]
MSHFAQLNENNIVIFVTVGRQEDDGKEAELSERTGDTYKQTSYNTIAGVYYDPTTGEPATDQSKAFRKNFAGLGYFYDQTLDAFIPPKPFESWVLDEVTCQWEAPVPYPTDGFTYYWNEANIDWELADYSEPEA